MESEYCLSKTYEGRDETYFSLKKRKLSKTQPLPHCHAPSRCHRVDIQPDWWKIWTVPLFFWKHHVSSFHQEMHRFPFIAYQFFPTFSHLFPSFPIFSRLFLSFLHFMALKPMAVLYEPNKTDLRKVTFWRLNIHIQGWEKPAYIYQKERDKFDTQKASKAVIIQSSYK